MQIVVCLSWADSPASGGASDCSVPAGGKCAYYGRSRLGETFESRFVHSCSRKLLGQMRYCYTTMERTVLGWCQVGDDMAAKHGKGDDGWSELLFGRRLRKTHPRFEAMGDVDELNSFLGLARAKQKSPRIKSLILQRQRELFVLGGELGCLPRDAKRLTARVDAQMIARLDAEIAKCRSVRAHSRAPLQLRGFVAPGASESGALFDICRSVCRRAERHVARLAQDGTADESLQIYLNRLSSLLFLMARTHD
jgi:cob(I)alamin adenosyltransferase